MFALNPFVWANPIGAAIDTAEARLSITAKRRGDFPTSSLLIPSQRLGTFVWRVFTHEATVGCARAFDRGVGADPETNQWRYGAYRPAKLLAETPVCQPWLGATPVTRRMTWINLALFAAGIAIMARGAVRHRRWELWVALGRKPLVFATLLQSVAIGAGAQSLIDLARRCWGRVVQP